MSRTVPSVQKELTVIRRIDVLLDGLTVDAQDRVLSFVQNSQWQKRSREKNEQAKLEFLKTSELARDISAATAQTQNGIASAARA